MYDVSTKHMFCKNICFLAICNLEIHIETIVKKKHMFCKDII